MASKKNIGARLPVEMVNRLEEMAEDTGKPMSNFIEEAIGQYLGMSVDVTADRLTRLERELEALRGKLRLLGS